jgi:formylglycine-generating enzyme required for sulfatase activity
VPLADVTISFRQTTAEEIGHFALRNEIGRGQFGSVWRAHDTRLDRIVAIKIPRREELDARTRQMILREAKAAASLDHPNIVRVYEVLEHGSQLYIVSEFIRGDTLKACLEARRYSYREAADFMARTALAIDYAHKRGVIHRDLKPADADGQPHITDFGLAKQEASEVTMTMTGDLLGTPAYMSPEQASGEGHYVDSRSDVFSLGVILYEMLTGQRPFQGISIALLKQIQSSDPRAPRTIDRRLPRDLETICLKALAKDKNRRYASAKDMSDDLNRFLDGQPIKARPASIAERSVRWLRKNVVAATIGLLALSSGASVLALVLSPSIPTDAHVDITTPHAFEILTDPAGARVTLFPMDVTTGEPQLDRAIRPSAVSPMTVKLLPSYYMVVARWDDGRFHEVYRRVPVDPAQLPDQYPHRRWDRDDNGKLSFPVIKAPELEVVLGMARFEGSDNFEAGLPDVPQLLRHTRKIDPFYLDTHEVTVAEVRAEFGGTFPGNIPPPAASGDGFPMTGTLFDYAVWCAERMGKRLPTEFEFEFAATNGGTTNFPWGDDERDIPLDVSSIRDKQFDKTAGEPPVYGLLTNGAEITISSYLPYPGLAEATAKELQTQIPGVSPLGKSPATLAAASDMQLFNVMTLRGGIPVVTADAEAEFKRTASRARYSWHRTQTGERVGFRFARSKSPRW